MFIYYLNYFQSRCDRSEMNKHLGVYFLKAFILNFVILKSSILDSIWSKYMDLVLFHFSSELLLIIFRGKTCITLQH